MLDLGGMDFQREVDAEALVGVQNRGPAGGEVGKTPVPVGLIGGRKGVQAVPDA